MTIPDIISEAMLQMGCSPEKIEKAKIEALSIHIKTQEDKARVFRELTPQEEQHLKLLARLYLAAILADPSLREMAEKHLKDQIQKN